MKQNSKLDTVLDVTELSSIARQFHSHFFQKICQNHWILIFMKSFKPFTACSIVRDNNAEGFIFVLITRKPSVEVEDSLMINFKKFS